MLTELQRQKLTRYFHVYDVDDDGRVGPLDFERVIENVRILHGFSDSSPGHRALSAGYRRRWERLRSSADADDDGSVDLEEWLAYWDEVIQSDERFEAEVTSLTTRLFEIFDTDEDGVLGPDEFADFYCIYGLSADLARRVFDYLDLNGDGVVSYEELVTCGDQFYRSDDPDAPGNRLFGP